MKKTETKKWTGIDLFNQVPVNIAVIDTDYQIVDSNRQFVETFGEGEGKKCYLVYKGRKNVCELCQAAQTFIDGKIRVSLEKVHDRKGALRYLRVRTFPYRNAEGEITHIIEMSADVTDRELALERYQTIFDNVPCYISVIDATFTIVTANKRFRETFGEDLGLHCFESYKKSKEICRDCPARLVFKDGKTHQSLQEGYDTKGNKVVYMVTVSPYEKKEGKTVSAIEMAIDITRTFELESRLKENLRFQEVIFQNATEGIIASNEDDVVNIYNPAAEKILRYPTEKLVGKKRGEEVYPARFLKALREGDVPVILMESKVKDSKGEEIPIVLSGTKLRKDGKQVGTVMFFQDLSKVKQLEHEILEAERLAAVGQTVAGLSHGIKNILMGLEGGMYVVNSGIKRNDNNLVKQGWEMLQNNIEKVSSFVKDFLSFAKGTVPQVELVDPSAIAREIIDLFKDAAAQSGIELQSKLQKNIDKAPMDPQGIHTCLANLVSNGIDACLLSDTEERKIELSLFEKNGTICYEVKDNGCGMSYDVKKKIFTNFFTTKGSGQGTGLGLLTTRKIVQEHGGKIHFRSTLEKGSTFTLEFPRSRLPVLENR
jgi:PAS domain S-box-containing protein